MGEEVSTLNRNAKLSIPCPKCKEKIQESIARLETNPTLTCTACGTVFAVKAEELTRGLQEVERLTEEFKRKISSIKIKAKLKI
jgi:uncharacterized Zn finger protein